MAGIHMLILGGRVSGVVPSFSASVTKTAFSASATSVQMTFETNGAVTGSHSGASGTFNDNASDKDWFFENVTGIGSSYWIRATLASGQTPSAGGTLNTWLSLSSSQFWTYNSGTGGAVSTRSGTLTIEISSDSSGTNILGTYSCYFEASREL